MLRENVRVRATSVERVLVCPRWVLVVISSRRGFIPAGPRTGCPRARCGEITTPAAPPISEAVPGAGGARLLGWTGPWSTVQGWRLRDRVRLSVLANRVLGD
jgi:hypothetical protein